MWGDAVEDRPLPIVGEKDPYTAHIGTLNTAEPLASIFGDDHTVTHVLTLELELLLDVKTKAVALCTVTVEVGIAGMYDHFKHLGKRGKKVALSSPDSGIHLTLTLDCNPKAYAYLSDNWQKFAAHCATNHLKMALTVDLDDDEAALVSVQHFSTQALVPLNNLDNKQSARGLAIHFLIKGVDFNRASDDKADPTWAPTSIIGNPIPLRGAFPSGLIADDGRTPSTTDVGIKLRISGLDSPPKIASGMWYPPSAQQALEARIHAAEMAKGGPSGPPVSAWAMQSRDTARRKEMRRIAKMRAATDGGNGAGKGTGKGAGKGAPGKRSAGRWSDADEDVNGSPGGYSNASDTRSVAQRMANASFGAGASRDQDDLT